MKKNVMMRIASFLMVAVLLSTCAISGTFAKYVTEATGSDSARVAKWNIQLEGAKMTNSFTFDLFNTIKDSDGTSAETDIKYTDGSIIAPGTSGSFQINLANNSEVNAKYSIDYTIVNNKNIPVQYRVNGGAWAWSIDDVADVNINMGDAPNITIEWKWDYNGDDGFDTSLGEIVEDVMLNVTATITVTQVD